MLHIVFASPQNLHRLARDFRNLCSFHHEVAHVPPAESAAHQRCIHYHLFARQAGNAHDNVLRPLWRLRWHPCLRAVGPNVHGAVHRLHRGVRGKREFVDCLHFLRSAGQRCVCVAVIAYDFARFRRILNKLVVQPFRRFRCVRSFIPGNLQRFAALHCRPRIVRQHGHTACRKRALGDGINRDYILYARNRLRLCGVKRFHLATENWAARNHGILHARHARINSECGLTGRLGRPFVPPLVMPHDREIIGILQRHRLEIRNRQLRRILCQFTVGQEILPGTM